VLDLLALARPNQKRDKLCLGAHHTVNLVQLLLVPPATISPLHARLTLRVSMRLGKLGLDSRHISACCSGRYKQTGGYEFRWGEANEVAVLEGRGVDGRCLK